MPGYQLNRTVEAWPGKVSTYEIGRPAGTAPNLDWFLPKTQQGKMGQWYQGIGKSPLSQLFQNPSLYPSQNQAQSQTGFATPGTGAPIGTPFSGVQQNLFSGVSSSGSSPTPSIGVYQPNRRNQYFRRGYTP